MSIALGKPIPDSLHAVSMSLPRWADVVGYEEKNPATLAHLHTGYPRFVIHPLVQQLGAVGTPRPTDTGRAGCPSPPQSLPFPSARVAELCARFVGEATINEQHVVTTKNGDALKAFWQHTGLIVCSRQAEALLAGRKDTSSAEDARRSLREQLAALYDCAPGDIFLAPTGMASQFAALQAVNARAPGRPTAQLGFPYVDTLKLQQKFGHGAHFFRDLKTIESQLHELIHRQPLSACFSEIPGNPLLGAANLREITPLLREHGVPLVADDVVATPFNINLSGHADLIATSLTKYIVGTGDAMGGALICNPRSPYYRDLKPIVQSQHEELLWGEEAEVLATQAKEFPARMKRHNSNGLFIAEKLRGHPAIEKVWFPKWEHAEAYEAVRRPGGGWGALITFLPKNARTRSPEIYDKLPIAKGPSLGTVFTLACPFTLLAHYTELDWAESCGVSQHLIRISVGLEDPQQLWNQINQALT
jgi:cystathionine gamma-synthase